MSSGIKMTAITVQNFNSIENSQTFLDGSRRSVAVLESLAVGRGEYLPGWRWSKHGGPKTGKDSGAHIGYIISGQMVIRSASGKEIIAGLDYCWSGLLLVWNVHLKYNPDMTPG
jgi:hypothetical protein